MFGNIEKDIQKNIYLVNDKASMKSLYTQTYARLMSNKLEDMLIK